MTSSPVRVTHLVAPVAFGGGEALLSNLVAEKRPDLVESVITLGQAPLLEQVLDRSGINHRSLGGQEVGVERKGKGPELLAALAQLTAFQTSLGDLRPDVIHSHGFPPSLLGALPIGGRAGGRVGRVYTHHYERQPPRVTERLALTAMFNRYDALTTVADHLSASMNSYFPGLHLPFETLRIAVGDEFFGAEPSGVLRKRFGPGTAIGVCVGRLVAIKNQRLLLESFAALPADLRAGVGIALVGTGPQEAELRRLATVLQVEQGIAFVGHVPSTSMPSLLADADFGIFPTVTEASSVAAAEALASGLPLLTLDIAAMRETAVDAGVFATPATFSEGLARLSLTFADMAPAAHTAAERFRLATVRDRWAALYHRVSSGR